MNLSQHLKTNSINESIRSHNIENAIDRLQGILDAKGVYAYKYIIPIRINNKEKLAVPGFNDKDWGVLMVWDRANHTTIEQVLFSSDFDRAMSGLDDDTPSLSTWDISVTTSGCEIAQVAKLIVAVMSGKIKMSREDIEKWMESVNIWECDDESSEVRDIIAESTLDDLLKERNKLYQIIRKNAKGDKSILDIQSKYANVVGAIKALKMRILNNVKVAFISDPELSALDIKFQNEYKKDPAHQLDILAKMLPDIKYAYISDAAKKKALSLLYKLSDSGKILDLNTGKFVRFAALCSSGASDRILTHRLEKSCI